MDRRGQADQPLSWSSLLWRLDAINQRRAAGKEAAERPDRVGARLLSNAVIAAAVADLPQHQDQSRYVEMAAKHFRLLDPEPTERSTSKPLLILIQPKP